MQLRRLGIFSSAQKFLVLEPSIPRSLPVCKFNRLFYVSCSCFQVVTITKRKLSNEKKSTSLCWRVELSSNIQKIKHSIQNGNRKIQVLARTFLEQMLPEKISSRAPRKTIKKTNKHPMTTGEDIQEDLKVARLSVMNYNRNYLNSRSPLCCLRSTEMLHWSFAVTSWRGLISFRMVFYGQMKPRSNCSAETQRGMFGGMTAALIRVAETWELSWQLISSSITGSHFRIPYPQWSSERVVL